MSILVHAGDEILSARYVRILRSADRCVAEVHYTTHGDTEEHPILIIGHHAIDPAAWDAHLRGDGSGMLHVGAAIDSPESVQAYLWGWDV